MECREIKKFVDVGTRWEIDKRREIESHIALCERCRGLVASARLASMLIKAGIEENETAGMTPFLMARIKNRIRELGDQSVGSWESAVLALRGWLLAFGTAAVILLSISIQWQLPAIMLTGDHETELTSISNINEVLISGNMTEQPEAPEAVDEVIIDNYDE
jgi:hypothetical protein